MNTLAKGSSLQVRAIALALAASVTAIVPAAAQSAPSVELICTRTSAIPTEPNANWVKFFDIKVDLSNRVVEKTTTLHDGERHDVVRNGEVTSTEAFTRTGVVSIEPDVLRFGYDVAPKDGAAAFHVLSTVDRITGAAVDNLSEFLCRRSGAEHLF